MIFIAGPVIYIAPRPGKSVSLTEALFPGSKSTLPESKVINMTYNCPSKQLDLHVALHSKADIVVGVLTLSDLVLSLRVSVNDTPTFITAILSANTKLFTITTFVAVRYDLSTEEFDMKGLPIDTDSLNAPEVVLESTSAGFTSLKDALKEITGTSLPIPAVLGSLTVTNLYGHYENGLSVFAVCGKSNGHTVSVILQKSATTSSGALIADIEDFNLADLVSYSLNIDISSIPVLGGLQISELGFSTASGTITSSLLPKLYESGSPLERFENTLPKGVSAYFTANVAGVTVEGAFLVNTVSFKVPKTASLSVKQLLGQIHITDLSSLPKIVSEVVNSQISGFSFDPPTKQLSLAIGLSEITVLPNILKLTNVRFMLSVTMSSKPLIENFKVSGTWKCSRVGLTTSIDYDGEKNVMKVRATPTGKDNTLQVGTLAKSVGGIEGSLPSSLTSLSLNGVVGSVYNNGNYFIAMSGTVNGGNMYLIFYRGPEGMRVGIAASLKSFQLSSLVQSAVGVDIKEVPYFGSLSVPALALSVTSGAIKSPALPHLFGSGSPLQTFGDTLPAGVTAQFSLDIASIKGAVGRFYNGIIKFEIPDSVVLSIQSLTTVVPDISGAIESLPSQVKSVLSARVRSFSFNSTSGDLAIKGSLNKLAVVSGFLTLSNISILYDGSFGQSLATKALEFTGTWTIGEYTVITSVVYDGVGKELTLASESSGGKDFSISNIVQSLAGTTIPLPAAINSFAFSGLSGRVTDRTTVVVLNGNIGDGSGKLSAVFEKSPSGSSGAIVIDINNFKLTELVEAATGIDISDVPFFGTLAIPELKFAAASANITSPLLAELGASGSALEWFESGIAEGVSGRFVIQIGDSKVAVNFVQQQLHFRVPDTSTLSLSSVSSSIPSLKEILSTLPSELASVLNAEVTAFDFDPASKELKFSGILKETIELVPNFLSLSNAKVSLILVLGPQKQVEAVELSGEWALKDLRVRTIMQYNRKEKRLEISGELDAAKGGVTVPELIKSLSAQKLSIPSVLSSVKLSKVSGNKIGDVTFMSLAGSVGGGRVFIILQKSPSEFAVAFAADAPRLKFSSLVSSAVGVDISGVPFFGSLEIPQIGLTIASQHINNILLSELFPDSSPLSMFGASISKGVTASFKLSIADVKGIVADFTRGELDLQVPSNVDLSLASILRLFPGLESLIASLPQTIQDIGSTKLSNLFFVPKTTRLEFKGSLDSLTIIPEFLRLENIEFQFATIIGQNSRVELVIFRGDWVINSLALTTEIIYEKGVLIISGSPAKDTRLNTRDFIKGLTKRDLNIPSVLDTVKFTQVVGNIQGGALSLVLVGEIGTKAQISVVYEQSKEGKTVAFAADVEEFLLSDLIRAGTGIDISSIPFFGKLVVPSISFVISSGTFSTANLPDFNSSRLHVPKELLFEVIPEGVRGQFLADIGKAVGLIADFADDVLTIEVPPSVSLSLSELLITLPEIKTTIDSLPDVVHDILSGEITKLVLKPATKDLVLSLNLDSLDLVPDVLSVQELKITLDARLVTNQGVTINNLIISGMWVIQGVSIETNMMYNKQTKVFNIEGLANGGQGVGIADMIKAFTASKLPVLSVLSSLKLTRVRATSSASVTTIIVTATSGNANVYLLYHKTSSATAVAIAAEVQAFKIVDLIKTATGLDLTGTPFIGSFVITTMAFSASTSPITSPLLATVFSRDSPLKAYRNTLSNGVTAHFEVEIGGKTGIAVTFKEKMLTFVLPQRIGLSLSDLLSEMPSISSVVNSLPSPMSELRTTTLRALDFDANTKTLSATATLAKLTIIPDRMVVTDVQVSFAVILSSTNGGLETLEFSANWVLGGTTLRVKVTYEKTSKLVVFAATSQGLTIQRLISSLTGSTIPFPSALNSAKLTKIVGRKSASVSTIIFSGSIGSKADVHVVYQSMGSSSQVGVAAGIKSFTFSELVRSAVNIDISRVPFFGKISVPSLALSVTNSRITSDLFPEVFVRGSPLVRYGDTLPTGFTAKFDAPIGKIKGIIGSYSNNILSFVVPPNVHATLGSLASAIGINVNSIGIGPVFGNIGNIRMKGFNFDVPQKKLTVDMFLQKVTFYNNILSVKDIQLRLFASFSPTRLSAEASGTISMGSVDYAVSVRRNTIINKYALTVETDSLPIFGVVTALGAKFLPDDLRIILQRVFQFNIKNARIVYPFGARPQQIQVSGIPLIFGLKTVKLTAVAFKYSGKIRMVQKYDFGTQNIADMIEKLIGLKLHVLKILDQTVRLQFVLSPNTIKGVKLSTPEFAGFALNQGINIKAPLDWPPDCSSDPFCKVAKSLLGGAKLSLEGTIANARSFTMTASIGDLKLGGGVVLLHAGLQFVGGANPSVGIVGSLELRNPKITLTAAIRVSVGVKLEGSMSGCWYNAFGSPYLTVCNLYLSMTILPAPLPISGLEFGGRIEVGKKSCGHVLTAEGYVGINVLNPNENFFYADVGPVTFQKFFDAFCLNVKLPRPLGDSGFPNGFKTSFSLLGRELPHAGISIPPGYRFKGTLDILGVRAFADIYIQLPTRITAKIQLPPLSLGSVFKMYRSSRDRRSGPFLNAEISTRRAPSIEAQGFVQVLGISVEARLLITSEKYELEITGKFLHLFEANLRVYAQYSKSFSGGSFMVEGTFKSDLFEKIARTVREGLKKSADEADKHISGAQGKIRREKAKFDAACDKIEAAKRSVDNAQHDFDRAIDKVNDARRKVDGICSYRSCGQGKP